MTHTTHNLPELLDADPPYPNLALLTAARVWLEEHPERMDMGVWEECSVGHDTDDHPDPEACGTRYCFAGIMRVLEDVPWAPDNDELGRMYVLPPGGRHVLIENWAREAGGLTHAEANALFYGATTLGDIDILMARVWTRAFRMDAERAARESVELGM